jgi:hypothetical protein
MKTICELLKEAKTLTSDAELLQKLEQIQECAGKMEDRLLKYCNSIEDLGFVRIGRDYNNQ